MRRTRSSGSSGSPATPSLQTLLEQYASAGGQMLVCPICFNARKLDQASLIDGAQIAGATPLWEWIADGAAVFSY